MRLRRFQKKPLVSTVPSVLTIQMSDMSIFTMFSYLRHSALLSAKTSGDSIVSAQLVSGSIALKVPARRIHAHILLILGTLFIEGLLSGKWQN